MGSSVVAGQIDVPKDHPTIQAAINAAVNGDEIIVAPGTYNEAINFSGKTINLHSSGGAGFTTLDGTGLTTSIVSCISGEGPGTIFEGFTVTNGTQGTVISGTLTVGMGMCIIGSTATVRSCVFTANNNSLLNRRGGGLAAWTGSNVHVEDCLFFNNQLTHANSEGGGMAVFQAQATVIGCQFISNKAGSGGGLRNNLSTLIVEDCSFDNHVLSAGSGGGMQCSGAEANTTITNCTFTGNASGLSGSGGAITSNSGTLTIDGCTFTNNSIIGGGNGGAVNISLAGSTNTITNSTFIGNSGGSSGGGALRLGNGTHMVANCTFTNNTMSPSAAGTGGAIWIAQSNDATATILDCELTGNHAPGGGGMYIQGSSGLPSQLAVIVDGCTFRNNAATQGGGIAIKDSKPIIRNCIIDGNTALSGGGLRAESSGAVIANCLVTNNHADSVNGFCIDGSGPHVFLAGGGMSFQRAAPVQLLDGLYYPIVTNCIVVNNTTSVAGGDGGAGIEVRSTPPQGCPPPPPSFVTPIRVSNCIVRGNTGGANVYCQDNYAGNVLVQNNNIEGSIFGPYTGEGNIDADPMFIDADGLDNDPLTIDDNDYHIVRESPGVDAGDNWDLIIHGITTDFEGNPRLADSDSDDDEAIFADMGIYELPGKGGTLGVSPPVPYAYFHFNTLPVGSTIPADMGPATIDLGGWGGPVFAGPPYFDVNRLWDTPGGSSLMLLRGDNGNGTHIDMSIPMSGQQDLVLSFNVRRELYADPFFFPTFNSGTWAYSTDGTNFTILAGVNTCPTWLEEGSGALFMVDFSAIEVLDNAPMVTLRYTLDGATAADRSHLIDNIQVRVTPIDTSNPADIDGNGVVNVDDLLAVIGAWGPCPPPPAECPADVDGNGVVNVDDLLLVINNWGS